VIMNKPTIEINYRYSLCPPVEGGCQFWMIEDLKEMFQYVTIHKNFPNAEQEAHRLFDIIKSGKMNG
jgi:hypothetical protein